MVTLFAPQKEEPKPVDAEIVPNTAAPLSPFAEKFLADYQKTLESFSRGADTTIKVSDVLGTIAHLYERVRNVVEYKGEHVLRRNAIERILKRLVWERAAHDPERIAHVLMRELIWARYLPNDTIPKSKVKDVAQIIGKYLFFLGKLTSKGVSIPTSTLREWVWGVASCEIEESLDPSNREPYVELMYEWFNHHFSWTDKHVSDHEKQIQIYLAIHRALTKSDEEIMRYHLLLKEYPGWNTASHELVARLEEDFYRIYEEIEKHLNFSNRLILYRYVQHHVAPFEVLREMVKDEGLKIKHVLADPEKFEWKVREICQRKYSQIQQKVNRGIFRSIMYIFITKVLFAMLVEIPYELYRFGELTYLPLAINVVVPPGMMFLIGLTIRAPGETNTQRILARLKTIVYETQIGQRTSFSLAKVGRGGLLGQVFSILYLCLFLIVFGGITYFLSQLGFNLVGVVIFVVFLSLVLLFGFRVKFTASELKVTPEKQGILAYLFDNLTLPFLNAGVYLSKGLARLNFFTIILDFLIEAPLKTIIEVIEEWTSFIREKREEVVEVPE